MLPFFVKVDGAIAKRLCTGLQIRLAQFDSGSRLQDFFNEINKKPTRPPSYIRQTIAIENKERIPTRLAAKYLGISEASLKRWEAQGVVRATKTRGGHRSFNLGELDRVKEAASRGTKPLTPEEEDQERLRAIMRKVQK